MSLVLSIQKAPDSVDIKESSKTFGSEGGTIGRGQDNTWVLDDPERFLSNIHCEISFEGNQFYVIDRSTNGTYHNGSSEPIGKGSKLPIHNKDTIILGDYEFSIVDSNQAFDAMAAPGANASDPFAGDNQQNASTGDDIFSRPLPNDPFIQDPGFNQVPKSAGSGSDPLFESNSLEADPLAALNKARGNRDNYGSDSLFETDQDPIASATYSDQIDPLNQQLSWAESTPAQGFGGEGAIPDDWDDDLFSSTGTGQSASVSDSKNAAPAHPVNSGMADRTFIDALGLDDISLSDADIVIINRLAGEVFREMVKGLMMVLASRNTIKNEFRMNVTTIQPRENNPLKFSPNVDDALKNMFLKQGDAYLSPLEAVHDGFGSIAEHQVAILAGIREAFKGVIERFEPELLKEKFAKSHKGGVLPVSSKAKNWEYYLDYYNELISDSDISFKYLFGDEFVRAYEEQLKVLSVSRKAKKSKGGL